MMRSDVLGNPVTAGSDASLAGINDFVTGFLGYETQAINALAAADADPGCSLLNSYAACLHLFSEDRNGPGNARPYLDRALAAARDASAREQLNAAAVAAWAAGDIPRALRIAAEIAAIAPRDLVSVKFAQYHAFNMGDAPAMLAIADRVASENDTNPHLHGMLAFGYEQCHLLDLAEASAMRAIDLRRKEPWAHHAMAHVMLTQGRIEEGLGFMRAMSDTWTGLNSFMVTHNWWHLALYLISLGRYDEALAAYDDHVWGVLKDYSQDQIGAISLLLRLELVGVDVGGRWDDVAAHLAGRTDDFVQPFLTMQYVYGLARGPGVAAEALVANLRAFAPRSPAHAREVWTAVALPACEAMLAHARGRHEEVVARLMPLMPQMIRIGGSHAQRDLFEQVLLDSVIMTGRHSLAQQMLELRRGYEPCSVPGNDKLARIYESLGLPREAARAQARVKRVLAAG